MHGFVVRVVLPALLALPLACADAPASEGDDELADSTGSDSTSESDSTGTDSTSESDSTSSDSTSETGPEPEPPLVVFSEIMYHPVLEQDFVDRHEFVELHNPGVEPVALAGWSVAGGISYAFPDDAQIDAGGYLVIAKDLDALALEYGLDAGALLGPYERELGNSDETLTLLRDDASLADVVGYDDAFPWPIAGDALGASTSWLPPELLPLEDHQYRGISLERVSANVPSGEISNWVPSPLDAASPGTGSLDVAVDPPPILLAKQASTPSADPLIRAGEEVTLDLEFTEYGTLASVRVDWFVDDVQVEGEAITSIAVPDAELDDRKVALLLPPQDDESIVRFRVFGDRGRGVERISPRPSDPHDWHAYFVSPHVQTDQRLYQLYLASDDWTTMWTNVQGGREIGCDANPTWDERVPGVFVYEGEVFDVQVRYQGSRWNRTNGPQVNAWPYPGPSQPAPLRALSYRIAFPRFHAFEGRQVVTLNKLTQGCPGLAAGVGFELFRRLDLPAPTARYIRFHVNGGYLRTMMEVEHPDEDMMAAYHEAQALDPMNVEPVGHLYKSVGLNADAGPFGWGDARPMFDSCGHDAYTRYTYTYDRSTHGWASHDPLIDMIETLDGYRNPNTGAIDVALTQAYLEAHFDVDAVMNHIAIMNFSVPFDDYFQNHFLYQRRTDDRWMLMPWDLDQNFGPWAYNSGGGPQASVFGGRNGQDVIGGIDANRSGWWNRIKDSFLRTYEDEYIVLLKQHAATTLHPSEIALLVDEVVASFDVAEANMAASPPSCNVQNEANAFKAFAQARHDYIVNTPAQNLVDW